jgi:hypothetical protein
MIRSPLLAAALLAAMTTDAAACHRFSVWHYPWRQSCGVAVKHQIRTISYKFSRTRPKGAPALPDAPAMPLPSLARADLDEPEADEAARARLLLRAALEAANER